MNCVNCGAPLEPADKFCPGCGHPQAPADPAGAPESPEAAEPTTFSDKPDGTGASESFEPPDTPEQAGGSETPSGPEAADTRDIPYVPLQPDTPEGTFTPEEEPFIPLAEDRESPAKPRDPAATRNVILLCLMGVVTAASIILTILFPPSSSGDFTAISTDRVVALSSTLDDVTGIYVGGTPVGQTDAEMANLAYSLDKETAVMLGGDYTLYLLDRTGVTAIAEGAQGADISLDGGAVAYVADPGDSGFGKLYLYTVRDGGTQEISDENILLYTLSPDGQTLGYVTYGTEDEAMTGYLWSDGVSEELGPNQLPLAVADGGYPLYYVDYDQTTYGAALHVVTEDGDLELIPSYDYSGVFLNRDLTQAIYYDGSSTCLYREGEVLALFDDTSVGLSTTVTTAIRQFSSNFYFYVMGSADFADLLVFSYGGAYDTDGTSVSEDALAGYMSDSQDKLFYQNVDGDFYSLDLTDSDAEPVFLMSSVYNLVYDAEFEIIYYLDVDDTLYYISPGAAPEPVMEDVGSMDYHMDSGLLYLISMDNALYVVDGTESAPVAAPDAEYVGVRAWGDVVYFLGSTGEADETGYPTYDIYCMTPGGTPELLAPSATYISVYLSLFVTTN